MHYFKFEDLDNLNDVAEALGCQPGFIQLVLEYPSTFYHKLYIPKKRSPNPRIVYEVNGNLKNLHKNILSSIAENVDFPDYVQGFVSKRSIVTNASLHLSRKYILNLDIKNFFESIKLEKIISVFESLNCNHEIASIFAQLCTLNECLVQGANTSPILANLVCIELDKELAAIGQECSCSYSRYADDITFSGEKVPKKKNVARCIEKYNFELNPDKWKCQCRGKAQYVTGLTVFDEVRPRLPKQVKRHLRQELYYIDKYGLLNHLDKIELQEYSIMAYINRIDGLIAFMYSVEPKCAYEFDTLWQIIRSKEALSKSRNPSKILNKHQLKKDLNNSILVEKPIQARSLLA